MKNKNIIIFTSLALVVAFFAAANFYKKSIDSNNEKLALENKDAPFVREHSPIFGNNKNNVTIVEFIDPQCITCKRFHPIVKKIYYEYKNETRFVYRYLANHNRSKFAIRLLEAARKQNKFKQALEIMFKYQENWGNSRDPKPELLWEYLKEANFDMKKLKADFNTINIDKILQIDSADSDTLHVSGTPTVFVNGKELKQMDYKSFLDLVENEVYK